MHRIALAFLFLTPFIFSSLVLADAEQQWSIARETVRSELSKAESIESKFERLAKIMTQSNFYLKSVAAQEMANLAKGGDSKLRGKALQSLQPLAQADQEEMVKNSALEAIGILGDPRGYSIIKSDLDEWIESIPSECRHHRAERDSSCPTQHPDIYYNLDRREQTPIAERYHTALKGMVGQAGESKLDQELKMKTAILELSFQCAERQEENTDRRRALPIRRGGGWNLDGIKSSDGDLDHLLMALGLRMGVTAHSTSEETDMHRALSAPSLAPQVPGITADH